ncbi:hypothetical protein BH23PLA1_BH23PLA1_43990 [soil metagenome]
MIGWLKGKGTAAKGLATLARLFSNWREVWPAYRAGRQLPTLVTRGGSRLTWGPGDDPLVLVFEIWRDRCYTAPTFYKPRPSDTVLDIGANIGYFVLHLNELAPGIQIHSFEPAAATRVFLQQNLANNGLDRAVTIYPLAVSDKEGELHLHAGPNTGHRSIFPSANGTGETESVRCVILAGAVELTGAEQIDLLKIDVEGAEVGIVEGADPKVWPRIRRVVVEYHESILSGSRDRVSAALAIAGYRVVVKPMPGNPGLGIIEAVRDAS